MLETQGVRGGHNPGALTDQAFFAFRLVGINAYNFTERFQNFKNPWGVVIEYMGVSAGHRGGAGHG